MGKKKESVMSNPLTPLEVLEATVAASAEDDGGSLKESFAQQMIALLEEVGELSGPETFAPSVGAIDALDWDEETARLSVIISDFSPGGWGAERDRRDLTPTVTAAADQISRLMKTTAEAGVNEAERRILSYVGDVRSEVRSIRIVVVSNGSYDSPRGTLDAVAGIPVEIAIWDAGDLVSLTANSSLRDLTLDLSEEPGGGIHVLGPIGGKSFTSFITVLRGDLVADLYQAHGASILGRNVRAFLQASNRVNRGIRETVKENPAAFFAFNNGLSLTAASVERDLVNGQLVITSITGLEIVNGGQTTASLHHAKYRDQVELSSVFVQAKLTVLPETGSDDFALQIAQFANSQSPVRMGDLTSNSKFFQSIEQLSRTVSFEEEGAERLWFFERMRGQFATEGAMAKIQGSEARFKAKHDRARRFDKSALAKVELGWLQMPAAVAAGNEKALAVFVNMEHGPARGGVPDEKYYRRLVAKSILWVQTDRVIASLALGGYKALDIAYTIALISNRTAGRFNLDDVARRQDSGDAWRVAVAELAPLVHTNLVTQAGNRNVSSWAKSGAAWAAVKTIEWTPDPTLSSYAPSADETRVVAAASQQTIGLAADPEEIAARNYVEEYGSDGWFQLSSWAKETDNLQGWQRGIAFSLGKYLSSGKAPTAKQVVQAVKILSEADRLGFEPVE
jgi:hypothetical protein